MVSLRNLVASFVFVFLANSADAGHEDHPLYQEFAEEIKWVSCDLANLKKEEQQTVTSSVFKVLDKFKELKENTPDFLLKSACQAYGQLTFIAPSILPQFDHLFMKLLAEKKIAISDLQMPHYEFKFGQILTRDSVSFDALHKTNNQTLVSHYKINIPLYFNRLLGQFKGSQLLIGGGSDCECGDANGRHPSEHFYQVDIEIRHEPDLVAHMGYLEHLYFFPKNTFDLIWFEHCTVAEFCNADDDSCKSDLVRDQYFRFTKPGAVFILQSYFYDDDTTKARDNLEFFTGFCEKLKDQKYSILANEVFQAIRLSKNQVREALNFRLLIFMKPLLNQPNSILDSFEDNTAKYKPKLELYRVANEKEQQDARTRALLVLGIIKVELTDTGKFLLSLSPNTLKVFFETYKKQ